MATIEIPIHRTTPEFEDAYLRIAKRMAWEKIAKGQDESFIKNATDDHIDAVLKTIGIKIVFKNINEQN
tara:strand:- start:689 stop:895 length:207 start_codon:yes stop_codon:yes gene_type:complete